MKKAENNRRYGEQTIVFVDEIHRFNKAQQMATLCRRLMAKGCRGRMEQAMTASSRQNLPRIRTATHFLLLTDISMDSRIASNCGGYACTHVVQAPR